MIGRISGILVEKKPPSLLVDVQGIGYEVLAPMTTFSQLAALNEPITLHTHLVVREDAHLLYGFAHQNDRKLFQQLIKINGVGPKLALGILSVMEPAQFAHVVEQEEVAALVKIPGVGKKTAERLVIELKDKMSEWTHSVDSMTQVELVANPDIKQEAAVALEALGYKPKEAQKLIDKNYDGSLSLEQLIRTALQGA